MNNFARGALLLILLGFVAPLFADSPETLVGGTVVTPAPKSRGLTSIASDGSDFFVAWSDGRAETKGALIGTRVTRNGQVLDPLGIRLASVPSAVQYPNVVWDGAAYLVTWTSGYWSSVDAPDVFAARVDRDGQIVMAPRMIAENASTSSGRYAASNGNVTVVAYRTTDYPGSTRVAVLDREGNTLRHETIITTVQPYQSGISVAGTASRFVVVWSAFLNNQINSATVQAIPLTADGRLDGAIVKIGTGDEPSIATDGARFLITSQHWIEPQWRLLSRTVNADLTQISAVQTLTTGYEIDPPSLMWRGNRYEVFVGRREKPSGDYTLHSFDLHADGSVLGQRSRGGVGNALSYHTPRPAAATNGSDVVVAFTFHSPSTPYLPQVFARVYRGNAVAADVHQLLSWSGNGHDNPDIAAGASGHLVAWNEDDGVYATRIDGQGRSLDGRGIRLHSEVARARVAFDGTNYVVAWLTVESLEMRYISPATGAIVGESRVVTHSAEDFAIAASPDATFVAFITALENRVFVTRIPRATRTPELPLAVSPPEGLVDSPALSWNGSTLLVVWNEIVIPRGDPPYPFAVRIRAARVTAGLSLLDPAPLLVGAVEEDTYATFGLPSVASNGEDWLVVTDLDAKDVLARRVLRNGTVEGNAPVKLADGAAPVVTWDGARYGLVWKVDPANFSNESSLLLAAVPASGPLAATRRALVSTHVVPGTLAVAPAPGGEVAVAYTKISFRPEHTGVPRTYLRFMDYGARGRVVRR